MAGRVEARGEAKGVVEKGEARGEAKGLVEKGEAKEVTEKGEAKGAGGAAVTEKGASEVAVAGKAVKRATRDFSDDKHASVYIHMYNSSTPTKVLRWDRVPLIRCPSPSLLGFAEGPHTRCASIWRRGPQSMCGH